MDRCIVYIENQTQQDMWCCGFSGDWGRYNGALVPPTTGRVAVASLPCESGRNQKYGWLMFARRYNDVTKYFQLYLWVDERNDCKAMGLGECTQQEALNGQGARNIDGTMPSEGGSVDCEKQTDFGLIQWRCAQNNQDPIGLNNMPVIFLVFNR